MQELRFLLFADFHENICGSKKIPEAYYANEHCSKDTLEEHI